MDNDKWFAIMVICLTLVSFGFGAFAIWVDAAYTNDCKNIGERE